MSGSLQHIIYSTVVFKIKPYRRACLTAAYIYELEPASLQADYFKRNHPPAVSFLTQIKDSITISDNKIMLIDGI